MDFQRQRFFARGLAMQFLFACDIAEDWTCDPEKLGDFAEMVSDIEQDLSLTFFKKAWKYARKIIAACCTRHDELDVAIREAAVNWALDRMGTTDRCILRVAACELLFFDNVPEATAINEAIELARKFGAEADSTRFVNGVMESIRKNKNRVILPLEGLLDDNEPASDANDSVDNG